MWAVLWLFGCGSSLTSAPDVAPVGIPILVDDVVVAYWPGEEVASLASLMPEEHADVSAWPLVRARGGARVWAVRDPATAYGPAEVRLYLDGDRPSVGIFRIVDDDLPEAVRRAAAVPATSLVGIEEVGIVTSIPAPPPRPEGAGLVVRRRGRGPRVVTVEALAVVPKAETQRRRDDGWRLVDVVDHLAGAEWVSVTLRADEDHLTVSRGDADGWTLKMNRKGEWIARGGSELRGLTELSVE